MADRGHELTDELLARLEERIKDEYGRALADAERKLENWLRKFNAEDAKQKKLLAAGEITEQDYKNWRYRHIMMGKQWIAMRDTLAADFHNANNIAREIATGEMASVYALNMDYGTYEIESGGKIDTGYTLYNHDAAERLIREEGLQLMPAPSEKKAAEIAANKDLQWNAQKIQSAVLQGILQGESAHEVALRLQGVAQMNYNSAVRYARTMTTSAQNAGRYEAYRRADSLGVELTIEWMATLDGRTRHDHRLMHGQRTTIDKPFHTPDGFTIFYPADCTGMSTAPQREIWNCRCTLAAWVKGFEPETVKSSPKMGGMSFEEWQHANEPKKKAAQPDQPTNPAEQSFADKIAAIKQRIADNGGVLSEADFHEAGKLLSDEYAAEKAERERLYAENVTPLKAEYDRLNKAENAAYDKAWDIRVKFRRGEATREEWEAAEAEYKRLEAERKAARKAWREAESKYGFKGKPSADWLCDKVGETREMGSTGFDIRAHLNGSKSSVVPDIEFAYSHYPKDWVEYSVNRGYLTPRKVNRGHYNDVYRELYISGSGDSAVETAFHELGHRFEKALPGLLDAEKVFYERRTDGCQIERLCDIFPGYGYRRDETTKRDSFFHAYQGKNPEQYHNQYFELVSMGFEDAYMNPQDLANDPDMQSWIYGLLLLL